MKKKKTPMAACLFPGKRANYCKVKTRVGKRFGENKEAQRNEKRKNFSPVTIRFRPQLEAQCNFRTAFLDIGVL